MDFEKLAREYVHAGCISVEGLAERLKAIYEQGVADGRAKEGCDCSCGGANCSCCG